jgi:hypothetical protein
MAPPVPKMRFLGSACCGLTRGAHFFVIGYGTSGAIADNKKIGSADIIWLFVVMAYYFVVLLWRRSRHSPQP